MDKKMQAILEDMESEIVNKMSGLSLKHEKVGFVFDERMLLHKLHTSTHVERPERAMSIYMNLIFKGLVDKLIQLPSEEISEEDLLRVHKKEYIEEVANFAYEESPEGKVPRKKGESKSRYVDTYDNFFTYESAKVSAGSLLSCCKSVVEKKVDNAFAIIRPPGHHANSNSCRGFCFFNNVAIAADYLVNDLKKRVAIVDWDVHHGDGTQEIFYDKQNPLFISLHRHDKKKFYPGTGLHEEVGEGDGKGYNINIPWDTDSFSKNNRSIGDAEYIYAFETVVLPVLNEYKPDIIIVSAGFDAAENDPLGHFSVTPIGYAYMTYQLKKICNNLIVALEGGYNVDSLSRCSEAVIRTLLNEPVGFKDVLLQKYFSQLDLNVLTLSKRLFAPSFYAIDQINRVKNTQTSFWAGLNKVETITPNRKLLRNDNKKVLVQLLEMLKEIGENFPDKYLFVNSHSDSERSSNINIDSSTNSKDTTCLINDFFKIRIGQHTLPENMKKSHSLKFKRRCINDYRTLTPELKFRLEGISFDVKTHKASFKEEQFNWVKRDGIFDTSAIDVSYLVSKFLVQTKIAKSDLIGALEELSKVYEKSLAAKGFDLYNVDIIVIPGKSEAVSVSDIEGKEGKDGKEDKEKKAHAPIKKFKKKKNEVAIKLNGIKDYSLLKLENHNETYENNNFYSGLRSLINFLSENILE